MPGREIWTLFQDSKNNIYTGTDCGLYRSENGGSSWQFIESFNCGDILSFAESHDGNIYMGGADRFHGIYKSTDYGISWSRVFNIDKSLETYSIIASPSGRIFISSMMPSDSGGVYATTASDTSWLLLNSGLQSNRSRYLAVNPDGYLYSTYGSIYRST